MGGVRLKKTRGGLDFYQNGRLFYDLSFNQIKLHGVDFWLNHLSAKTWFTETVKRQFLELLN